MTKMAADLMPDLHRGRRSLDPAAWLRAIAWHHLVSGGMTQREAARVMIRWDDESGAPGADSDAAALLRRVALGGSQSDMARHLGVSRSSSVRSLVAPVEAWRPYHRGPS